MPVYIIFLITFCHFTTCRGLTVSTLKNNIGKIMTSAQGNQNQVIPGGVFNSQSMGGPTQGVPNGQAAGIPLGPGQPTFGGQQTGGIPNTGMNPGIPVGATPTYGSWQQGGMTGVNNGIGNAGPASGNPGAAQGTGGQQIGVPQIGGKPPSSMQTGGGSPLALLIAMQIPVNNWIADQPPGGTNGIPTGQSSVTTGVPTGQSSGTTGSPTVKGVPSSSTTNIPNTTTGHSSGTTGVPPQQSSGTTGSPTVKGVSSSSTTNIPNTTSTPTPDAEWITAESSTTVSPDSNILNTSPLTTSTTSPSGKIMVNSIQPITKEFVGSFEQQCEDVGQQIRMKRASQVQITVVGGQNSMENEFPHMAALGYGLPSNKQWLCGGSLVSENYVITAGHCLSSTNLGEVQYVKLGTANILQNNPYTQEFGVVRKIPHPDFNGQTLYNDIALLQLDRPAVITEYVSPICMWSFEDFGNRILQATGWGRTDMAGPTSQTLQKVSLELYSQVECQQAYSTVSQQQLPFGIQETTQICAGSQSGRRDTCQGDSGGPLQVRSNQKWYLVGITSFGITCGTTIPGVYTKISPYRDWVKQVIWNK